jgi:hypothetical protein
MNEAHPPPPEASPAPDQRVAALVGDRICVKCGYNLHGQPVVRESHYHMLIVRCAECGTVASVQEYPLLGRWANRWAVTFAALWFLLIVALLLVTAGTMTTLVISATMVAAQPYTEHINEKQHAELEPEDSRITRYGWMSDELDADWWARQDADALFEESGGWRAALRLEALVSWGWQAMYIAIFAAVISIAMLHLRRLLLVIPVAICVLLAAVLSYLSLRQGSIFMLADSTSEVAQRRVAPAVGGVMIAVGALIMFISAIIARPLIRALVRLLLPPRMINSLSLLWTAEGKDLPRPPRAK